MLMFVGYIIQYISIKHLSNGGFQSHGGTSSYHPAIRLGFSHGNKPSIAPWGSTFFPSGAMVRSVAARSLGPFSCSPVRPGATKSGADFVFGFWMANTSLESWLVREMIPKWP